MPCTGCPGIADLFLVHDRPIERHVDDSVVQLIGDEVQPLRRARGYAPLPIQIGRELPTILAVGGHLKNVVALSVEDKVFLSQHIGDMETPEARAAFERVIGDFVELYEAEPACIARDLHPEYPSSKWVESQVAAESPGGQTTIAALAGLPTVEVQHHHAHLASVLAEHRIDEPALGVVWDGTGYGLDGTIWGGEFLVGDTRSFDRLAALRSFRLPGGDAAVRQPKRVALALLWELEGREGIEGDRLEPFLRLSVAERRPLIQMLEEASEPLKQRVPVVSSMRWLRCSTCATRWPSRARQRCSWSLQPTTGAAMHTHCRSKRQVPATKEGRRSRNSSSTGAHSWRPFSRIRGAVEESV